MIDKPFPNSSEGKKGSGFMENNHLREISLFQSVCLKWLWLCFADGFKYQGGHI